MTIAILIYELGCKYEDKHTFNASTFISKWLHNMIYSDLWQVVCCFWVIFIPFILIYLPLKYFIINLINKTS